MYLPVIVLLAVRRFLGPWVAAFCGQAIACGSIGYSIWKRNRKVSRKAVILYVTSLILGIFNLVYPSAGMRKLLTAVQIGVLLIILDPILERSALAHRAKRLQNSKTAEQKKYSKQR